MVSCLTVEREEPRPHRRSIKQYNQEQKILSLRYLNKIAPTQDLTSLKGQRVQACRYHDAGGPEDQRLERVEDNIVQTLSLYRRS